MLGLKHAFEKMPDRAGGRAAGWHLRWWLAIWFWGSIGWAGQVPRVVAIGDIHGNFNGLTGILRQCRLIDEYDRWIGGGTILVQTGDMLDRGAHVRPVMDLLMRLQDEAPRAGGKVLVLLGNHEVMNLVSFVRDVNPAAYANFTDAESVARQADAYQEYQRWTRRRAAAA